MYPRLKGNDVNLLAQIMNGAINAAAIPPAKLSIDSGKGATRVRSGEEESSCLPES